MVNDHQFGNKTKFWTIFKFVKYWNMWDVKYLTMNFTQHLFKFDFLHFAWFCLNYVVWLFMFCIFFSKRTSFSIFCILESNSNSTQFPWKKKCQLTTYFRTLKDNHVKIFNMFCRVKIIKPCKKNQVLNTINHFLHWEMLVKLVFNIFLGTLWICNQKMNGIVLLYVKLCELWYAPVPPL